MHEDLKQSILELMEPGELVDLLDLEFPDLIEYLEEAIEENLAIVEEHIDDLST